ncbi:polyamine transporter [Aspergillus ellipticus CBS 707.79]|uniref:Polyamine transporter n=1 Tax=Aspergillus ellipticus CBS 707.79 TaxID=1448320 RepID=A0A319DIB8_9EURO|nr:polyamine transporter [Aspergillus ellipticus CBS 707.79]
MLFTFHHSICIPWTSQSLSSRDYRQRSLNSVAPEKSPNVYDSSHLPDTEEDDDHLNPRKWSPWKKRLMFLSLMCSSNLADGGMVWGSTLIVPQAEEWGISVDESATSMNYGMLLQGIDGLMAIPFIEAYGRLPVWLWPQVITTFMVLGATLSNDFATFTTFRSLQGLFGTIPQVVGLPIIHDMYEPKDWPQMINICGTTFLIGCFIGPALAGYIGAGSNWKVSFGMLTVFYGISSIMILLFGYETYFVRGQKCQRNSRALSMLGIRNHNLPALSTLAYWSKVMVTYIFKFPLLMTGIATMVNFCWPIGYAFGFWFNDWIRKSRDTTWRPEYRLHGTWFSIAMMAWGLLTYGFTLNYGKHWIGLAFGWGMVVFGMVASTVSVDRGFSHSEWLAYTASGFSVGYFQPAWITRDGVAAVFGTQAAVVVADIILTIVPVIVVEGRKAREKVGAA